MNGKSMENETGKISFMLFVFCGTVFSSIKIFMKLFCIFKVTGYFHQLWFSDRYTSMLSQKCSRFLSVVSFWWSSSNRKFECPVDRKYISYIWVKIWLTILLKIWTKIWFQNLVENLDENLIESWSMLKVRRMIERRIWIEDFSWNY